MSRLKTFIAGAGVFGIASVAVAEPPLDLILEQSPDIFASFLDVTYDSGTSSLVVSGFADEIDDDGLNTTSPLAIVGGTFDLTADVVDVAGAGVGSNGAVTIGGTVAALGANSGTLLTGTMTAFGSRDSGAELLEFIFSVTGGDLAGIYGGNGASFGIIMSQTGFVGDFTSSFDNLISGFGGTGNGFADVAPIPAPASAALLLAAGGMLTRRRR